VSHGQVALVYRPRVGGQRAQCPTTGQDDWRAERGGQKIRGERAGESGQVRGQSVGRV